MVARVALASNHASNTEIPPIGGSGVEFESESLDIKPIKAVENTTVSRARAGST